MVTISCNPVGKIFCTFYLFRILCFRLELRSPFDVNREGSIFTEKMTIFAADIKMRYNG